MLDLEVSDAVRKYEYGRIDILARKLEEAGVAPETIEAIMEGGESILRGISPEKKADWMRECMARMDLLLDTKTRRSVRESCACCLGGKRLEMVKAIGKTGGSLAESISAANEARLVFGHSVEMQEDGRILVRFSPEGLPEYRCVCLPKSRKPVSKTYCYCCGGHVKHHLQIALGKKLECEVQSSALSSGGKRPCSFLFTMME